MTEAMSSNDKIFWNEAIKKEMNSMKDREVFKSCTVGKKVLREARCILYDI